MTDTDPHFYTHLPTLDDPLWQLLNNPVNFSDVPPNWTVLVTDVEQSSQAIAEGKHQWINLLATGSIIAVLNLAHGADIEIPFFFGGDGATILVPPLIKESALAALIVHRRNSLRNFDISLRVGAVKVEDLIKAGHILKLAKVQINAFRALPVIMGSALGIAEKWVKTGKSEKEIAEDIPSELDLSGMECRWNNIKPPQMPGEVMALLVQATNADSQNAIYAAVMASIERIFGPLQDRNPISVKRLKVKASLQTIRTEMTARLGRFDLLYLLKNWLFTFIGKIYYGKTEGSRLYLENLVHLSDTLSLDGRINTVISGTAEQRRQLIRDLDDWESNGDLIYGYYVSAESIMSCYVRNRIDQHIHFVDGAGGAYTEAAKILKSKLPKSTVTGSGAPSG